MESKCDYAKLYNLGKYGLSMKLLKERNPKTEIDACVLSNNRIVCSALLQVIESKGLNEEAWREVLYSFVDLHAPYRCMTKVPLCIELNIVYNLVWWYSSKQWSFEQNDVFESTVLEALSQSLLKVLNVCKDVSVISEFEVIDMNFILTLVKKSSDHMLSLTPVETIQLLDIYTVLSHLILKKNDQELSGECLQVLDDIIKRIEIIKLHLTSNSTKNDHGEECFKFGFSCVNSSSSLENNLSSLEAFMISMGMLESFKHSYRTALKYLHNSEMCVKTEAYKYIWNYFKAFCHMNLDEYNEAEQHLSYISRLPMDNQRKFYYFLLLGRLHSHRQQHDEAMKEFHSALETRYNTSSALTLTIMELQALSQPVMQLILLEKLVADLSNKNEKEELNVMKMCTLEDRCLINLYQEFQVTLPEALYMFARHAYVTEHYSLSLELYLNSLKSIKEGCLLEYRRERRLVPLPCTPVIIHEAVLAHLGCDNLTEAEKLCITAVDDYFPSASHLKPQRSKLKGLNLDSTLFSMDEDVFALILLTDIKIHQQNYRSANDYLDRCINAIAGHQVLQESSGIESSDMNKVFLKHLLGRIYLRKARISEVNNDINNAYHYYKRAVMYAPGDAEILNKYKVWLMKNNRIDDSDDMINENSFPFVELENITLRYILTYTVDKIMSLSIEDTCVKMEEVSKRETSNKEENFVADIGDLFDDEFLEIE